MAIAHAHLAPWAPGSNLAVRVNRAIDDRPGIQQEAICYQWFKQRLILSVSKPSISQPAQIKFSGRHRGFDGVLFNLKAYAAVTWHSDQASLGIEPRLADHRSHAARTATLPTAPPRQAYLEPHWARICLWNSRLMIMFNQNAIKCLLPKKTEWRWHFSCCVFGVETSSKFTSQQISSALSSG